MNNNKELLTHMLGHGLNHLISKGIIDMNSVEPVGGGCHDFNIGDFNCRVSFYEAGHGEFSINVHFDFDHELFIETRRTNFRFSYLPITERDPKVGKYCGAVACCWVERRCGKWLQINKDHAPFGKYIRVKSKCDLSSIPVCKPLGFNLNGKFYF